MVITVVGVLYFGLFSDGIIQRFSVSPAAAVVKAEK